MRSVSGDTRDLIPAKDYENCHPILTSQLQTEETISGNCERREHGNQTGGGGEGGKLAEVTEEWNEI